MFNFFQKKIIVFLRGGLGNQLFIYTASQSFAAKNNIKKIIYVNSGDLLSAKNFSFKNIQNIPFYIKDIKIKNDFIANNRYLNFIYIFLKYKIFNKTISDKNILDAKINFFNRTIVMDGFFQNKKFFSSKLEETLDKIYINKIKKQTKKFSKQKIIISISLYSLFGYTLTNKYYLSAIKKLKIKKNDNILITYDDISYAELFKTYLKSNGYKNVSINSSKKNAFDDFITIVNSKKLIMSNSTFCWWAAVLRKKIGHEDKQVACPKNWLNKNNKKIFDTVDLRIKNQWNYL